MKRWFIRIVVILAIVEVAYFAVVNVVLNLQATQDYVNQLKPERITYKWDRAWSWFPFRVHATNLVLNGQSWSQQFELSAPTVSLSVAILPLFTKTAHLYDVTSADVDVRFRPRPMASRKDAALRPFYPTIEGRDPTLEADPVPTQSPGWMLIYDIAEISGSNKVWLGPTQMTLDGDVRVTVARQNLNGPLTISNGDADVAIEGLTIAGQKVTDKGSIKGTFSTDTYMPQDNRGFKVLGFLTLDADIELPVNGLEFLDIYLKEVSGLNLGGNGGLKGHIAFANGDLVAGTDLALSADTLTVDLAPYSVKGGGVVSLTVDADTSDTLDANFKLSTLSALHQPDNQTLFTGTDLVIDVERTPRLLPGAIKEKVPQRVALTIPKVTVPDVSVYQRYVPEKWKAQVLSGTGELDGHAELSANSLDFDLTLRSEDADVKLREDSFETGMVLGIKAKGTVDGKTAEVDVSGSYLDLDDSRVTNRKGDSDPWQTKLTISEGKAQFDLPEESDAAAGYVGFWSLFHDRDLKAMLATADAKLKATLFVSDLNWVNFLFKNPYSLAIYNSAEVTADVTVVKGALAEGSTVKMPDREFRVEVLDYVAVGQGGFDLVVEKGGEEPDIRLDANLANASFRLQDEKAAVVEQMTLAVTAHAKGVSLKEGGSVESVVMNVPTAKITDMTAYNAYLPKSSPVRILSGTANLSAKLNMQENSATGFVKMKTAGVEADVGGDRISGTIGLDVAIGGGSAKEKTFDIGGSSLSLDGLRVSGGLPTDGNWSGRVDISKGRVVWKRPMTLDVTAGIYMADARPLAAFFNDHRKEQKWLDRILSLKNIRGNATIKVSPKEIVIPYAMAKAEPVEVGAKGIFAQGNRQAMFFARYGKLSGILEIDGSHRRFGLFGAARKFQDYVPGGPLPGLTGSSRTTAPAHTRKPFSIFKRK
ncbi:hypothetical protein [Bauldia litoralis]|uniref:hypothetical protein n=1 Tax=Bauldia litoralis TaxID=665467 RepID=UPI003265E034